MTSRSDNKLNVTQDFSYDELNRVTDAYTYTKGKTQTIHYAYDLIGNITYKSDVGIYRYTSDKPHQVAQAGNIKFLYDANGNMLDDDGTLIEYTVFNKPNKLILRDDIVRFYYDPNKTRYKKTTKSYTTYYQGREYERTEFTNKTVQDTYFIYVGGKVVSIYSETKSPTGQLTPATKYLHYDSLDSVDTITNAQGVVEERFAYKPFGERLNLDKYGNETKKAAFTNRGFTGHEHIEEADLIHMNGRVYDPRLGRFTSADPTIPYVYSTQSFNRYSYARNNPLKYIDPTGFTDEGGSDGGDGGDSDGGVTNLGTITVTVKVTKDNTNNTDLSKVFSGGSGKSGSGSHASTYSFTQTGGQRIENMINRQEQRMNMYPDEYPKYKQPKQRNKFVDIIQSGVEGTVEASLAVGIETKNPYAAVAAGVLGFMGGAVKGLIKEGTGYSDYKDGATQDFVNGNVNNPYTNPAANPGYF